MASPLTHGKTTSDISAQDQRHTSLFPSLPLIRGNIRRRSSMFQIGSPGREDDYLTPEAAQQLLSILCKSLLPSQGKYTPLWTNVGNAISVVKVPCLLYKHPQVRALARDSFASEDAHYSWTLAYRSRRGAQRTKLVQARKPDTSSTRAFRNSETVSDIHVWPHRSKQAVLDTLPFRAIPAPPGSGRCGLNNVTRLFSLI
jgi:hypothetical protein